MLFREVRAARTLLARLLSPGTDGTELHRQVGRLSGLLGNLAQQGRDREAATALDVAVTELEGDPVGQAPGRSGFDEPELALHQAEAHLTLGRTDQARAPAEASAAARTTSAPGWAAAILVLAAVRRAPGARRRTEVTGGGSRGRGRGPARGRRRRTSRAERD